MQDTIPLVVPQETVEFVPFCDSQGRRLWTREEYHAIAKLGILDNGKYELIEGEIIAKMPQDRNHMIAVMRCQYWLSRIFGAFYVQSQGPILADTLNEPEPDIAVFQKEWEKYLDTPPISEAKLFVEVTNTTQTQDRQVKRNMYARNAVPEYWILDLQKRTLTVHRQPLGDEYAQVTIFTETQSVTPLQASEGTIPISVTDLLAPVEYPEA